MRDRKIFNQKHNILVRPGVSEDAQPQYLRSLEHSDCGFMFCLTQPLTELSVLVLPPKKEQNQAEFPSHLFCSWSGVVWENLETFRTFPCLWLLETIAFWKDSPPPTRCETAREIGARLGWGKCTQVCEVLRTHIPLKGSKSRILGMQNGTASLTKLNKLLPHNPANKYHSLVFT